ncbi:amino acid ABC transporter substrate-binding protein [Rhodospirillaceae bacterium KN72]|uniref:Amino acid ABC transporter substrate-binding protein n=1 Tax=Pacificispira spongiicola TaxID=2729598 RepID=A0A7Y0HFS6_9PROT|nr:hypothetical protein [Pacificispira spongiicola]NMM46160.1 amino acid ABC transporter substrate-binding protein [Pacificispira spongiicola]
MQTQSITTRGRGPCGGSVRPLLFGLFLLLAVGIFPRPSQAEEELVFAVGEWPPFVSELQIGYGTYAQKVVETYKSAGYKVRLVFMPWQRAIAATKIGDFVATFPWRRTKERNRDFFMSEREVGPHIDVPFYDKTRFPEGLDGETLDDLIAAGYQFGGVRSYTITEILERKGAKLHIVSQALNAWKMLDYGRIDIFVENVDVGMMESADFLGADRAADIAHTKPVTRETLHIAFSREHPLSPRLKEIWDSVEDASGDTVN